MEKNIKTIAKKISDSEPKTSKLNVIVVIKSHNLKGSEIECG